MSKELAKYIEWCSTQKFSWQHWHCVDFIVSWADRCDSSHGDAFERWRGLNLDYDEIETEVDARRLWIALGLDGNLHLYALALSKATGMKLSNPPHNYKPGMVILREGNLCGIIDNDLRPLFLMPKGGLRHSEGYRPSDKFLIPKGL